MKHFLTIFLLFLIENLLAQQEDKQSIFQLLQRTPHLEITLKSDFKNLKKNKNRDDYQPASLSFTDENGQLISWDLEIKPRGKMRRRVCAMPPLKLKFPKDEVKAQGLAKYRTLEMVEICNFGKDYEQYVLREYVAYKLYNMLTNNSFRVQLVKVDFQDAEAAKIPMDGFGFLIENNEEMAERLGGKILEPESIGRRLPDTKERELFNLFQFMIGNTDWWATTAHNLDIFSRRDSVVPFPIPYDFDYAGFVNTPYAVPNDKTPLKYVTERYYQGNCRTEAETQETIQVFLDKKTEMLNTVRSFHISTNTPESILSNTSTPFSTS